MSDKPQDCRGRKIVILLRRRGMYPCVQQLEDLPPRFRATLFFSVKSHSVSQ